MKISGEITKLKARREDEIAALFSAGTTYQATAELVGCSLTLVQDVVRRRGLQRRGAASKEGDNAQD
jgi:hypothetical protein